MMSRCNKSGISLIEILIVLALVVLIFTLSFSQYVIFNRLAVASELDVLHATCMYARQRAIASGSKKEILFDVERSSYICEDMPHVLNHSVLFGSVSGAYGSPGMQTSSIKKPITFTHNTLTISAEGIANAGTVYLVDSNQQYSYSITSPVAQFSYFRCYCYHNGQWVNIAAVV